MLSGNEILIITKGHKCVVYLNIVVYYNSNVDLANVNACAKLVLFRHFVLKILSANDVNVMAKSPNHGQSENSIL